ncbi:hypothetical protein V5799_019732 [Amblyomma americanum]|uniref:Uncharacterized protein n=1 Tax=Amblyomma americanum TaxID=6943 RepID=A0AAQ4EVN3_AMBAM
MFSRRIAPSSTEQDDKAPALMTPGYSGNGPEWLQVTCEESQGCVTIPHYDDEDGLIPGVDFSGDEHSMSPQQCQPNFTATTGYNQQSTSNHPFPWPPVQSDEHPLPKSPLDQPGTPSVRWALRQHPQGGPTWSLQSSDNASTSSFTPCTSTSYRGSPQSGSSAVMTAPIHLPQTPANTRELPHNLQQITLRTPQPGLQPSTGILDTPANTTSLLLRRCFTPRTPAPMRRPPSLRQINMQGTRTPHLGLQQTRCVPESPMTRSISQASQLSRKNIQEKSKGKEQVNFQHTSVQDSITSQSCHQEKGDAFDTSRGNSSPLRGQSCRRIDVKHRTEPPADQGGNVQEARDPQHSLEHKTHVQGPPKAHTASVTVQDHHDLQKRRSNTVHIQHSTEENTRTPTSAHRHRKTASEINVAPADPEQEAVCDAPMRSYKDKSAVGSAQVAPKPADKVVEYPSVSDMRNMDGFYKSAWVLELQRTHQELLMKEIKAQIMYKPADRFSIMSIFEDNDDPFMGHKSCTSSLPYRTLDEELHISTGSSSSSPASQDIARHTGTKSSTKRRRCERNIGSKDSSQRSNLKTRPAVDRHSQPNSSQSLNQHNVSPECPRHVVQGEVEPSSSEVREAPAFKPLPFKEEIGKQKLCQGNVSPNSDKGKATSRLIESGASGSESGTQQGDRGEQCTLLTSTADPARIPHGDIPQQVSANELKCVTILREPSLKQCRCGELKVNKACQAQPDVSTVSTSYDA